MTNITRSDRNYKQHKKDIANHLAMLNKPTTVKKFMDFYSSRYDEHDRSYIDWKLARELYKDYKAVAEKNTMVWYGVVGLGGVGKTTTAKNIAYFLDNTFDSSRVQTKLGSIIDMFYKNLDGVTRSFVLDEPDFTTISPNSKKGMVVRDVFGKARQQKAFVLFCATDMTDIPNFIFKKLNRLIFVSSHGCGIYFKDKPRKRIYYIGKLKKDYLDKISYQIFFKYLKFGLKVNLSPATPMDTDQEKIYNKNKVNDYKESLKLARDVLGDSLVVVKKDGRQEIIKSMKDKDMTLKQIGDIVGLSESGVSRILNKRVLTLRI